MKEIKAEWCKNWIKKQFERLPKGITGIETNLMFDRAEKAGLYVKGTYGTAFSDSLYDLTDVRSAEHYSFFVLKEIWNS